RKRTATAGTEDEGPGHDSLSAIGLALSLFLAGAGAHGPAHALLAVAAGAGLVAAQPGGHDGHLLRRAAADAQPRPAAGPRRRVLSGRVGLLELPGLRHHSRLPVLLPGGAVHPAVSRPAGHLPAADGAGGVRAFPDRP